MGKRKNNNLSAAVVADDAEAAYEAAAMNNVAATTDPTDDPEIAELLASVGAGATEAVAADAVIDNDTGTIVADDTTETPADPATEVETAEMEEPEVDVDSVLAEVEKDEDDQSATASKPKRKKADPKPAVIVREFSEVASISRDDFVARIDAPETAKKIAEKARNLLDAVEKGSKLSRYTKVAVKTLAANGRVSGKTLVEAFEAEGLKLGTARAQAQQMTSLFKISGICTPDAANARELVVADSKFVEELEKLAA